MMGMSMTLAAVMTKYHSRFFLLDPPLLCQNPDCPSSLQLLCCKGGQPGYNSAHSKVRKRGVQSNRVSARQQLPSEVQKNLGTTRRGITPIDDHLLRQARAKSGRKAGSKLAGNGSSAKQILAKTTAMKRYMLNNGAFPSRSTAHSRWQVSNKLWERSRQECSQD